VERQSWESHESHVRLHLTPRLGPMRLAKLETQHVTNALAEMVKAGVSKARTAKVGTTLAMALQDAVRSRLRGYNPAEDATRPRSQRPDIQVWNGQQVKVFLRAAAGHRQHALYALALDSGMRQGERSDCPGPGLTWRPARCGLFNRSCRRRADSG
jgi:site-specific recombinase XerD